MLPNKIDLMIKLPIIHNRPHKVEAMHKKSHAILEFRGTLKSLPLHVKEREFLIVRYFYSPTLAKVL
jgi:hypothetical protein